MQPKAIMAGNIETDGRGPFNFMRQHCRTIQLIAAGAFLFLAGMAIGNYHVTADALNGQAQYFVHSYTPKVAAKAASSAIQKTCPDQ